MELPIIHHDSPQAETINKQAWVSVSPKDRADRLLEAYAASTSQEHKALFQDWADELATAQLNPPTDGPARLTLICVPRYDYPHKARQELICIFDDMRDAESFVGWIVESYSCKFNTFEPVSSDIMINSRPLPLRAGPEMKKVLTARSRLADRWMQCFTV